VVWSELQDFIGKLAVFSPVTAVVTRIYVRDFTVRCQSMVFLIVIGTHYCLLMIFNVHELCNLCSCIFPLYFVFSNFMAETEFICTFLHVFS